MIAATDTISAEEAALSPRWRCYGVKFLALALVGSLLSACTGTDFRTDYQVSRDRAVAYIAANPALTKQKQAAIRQATLLAGMSKREVIASWGRPVIVQTYRDGSQEYWLFGCYWPHICNDSDEDNLFPMPEDIFNSHAVFENGKLVSWHG